MFLPVPVLQDESFPMLLPKTFTVLVFLGDQNNESFYGGEIIENMVKNLPYNFIILGSKNPRKTENADYLGFIDRKYMKEIYTRSTVLVRITKHDGFSNMVQEALSYGRHVIWSQKYPYCHYANNYDSVVACLEQVSHNTKVNILGMEYYKLQFNIDNCVKRFIDLYQGSL
jgi:glycosyltransferase involved in cell wall biosynthesis